MRVYTANELQALVDKAYRRGVEDARHRHPDSLTEAPRLAELHEHDYGSSLLSAEAKQVRDDARTGRHLRPRGPVSTPAVGSDGGDR